LLLYQHPFSLPSHTPGLVEVGACAFVAYLAHGVLRRVLLGPRQSRTIVRRRIVLSRPQRATIIRRLVTSSSQTALLNESELDVLRLLWGESRLSGDENRRDRIRLLTTLLRCVERIENPDIINNNNNSGISTATTTDATTTTRSSNTSPAAVRDTNQLFVALLTHEIDILVDQMSYDDLYEVFGGPVGRGMSEADIAALPIKSILDTTTATMGDDECDMTCAICLAAFDKGQNVKILPACRHVFHTECVDMWLPRRAQCPVCRTEVAKQVSPS
jgi:hypothetical protein